MNSRPTISLKLLCIALVMLIFTLSGCGEPKQGLPGGAAPAVIEIWHSLQGPEAKVLEKQSERIMTTRPEVLIQLEYIAQAKMVDKAFKAQAGGEGPDIFITSGEIIGQLYNEGALAPIAGFSDSFPGVLAPFHYGEKDYAQPIVTDVLLFYSRTDKGQPPRNLADLLNINNKLVIPELSTRYLSPWWDSLGGKLTTKGQVALNDSANNAFLELLLAWKDTNRIIIDPNAWNEFVEGSAAYTIGWASSSKSLGKDISWNALPLTNISRGKGQIIPGRTMGIANSSIKSTEEMKPFIRIVEEELLSPEAQLAFSQAGGRFPVSSAFYSTDEGEKGIFPLVKESFEKAWPINGNALERKLIPIQDKMWQNVWNGMKPEDALNQAQTEAERVVTQQ